MSAPQNINILCKGTKAQIEAFAGLPEGSIAYATDTNELGTYNGTTWAWGEGGLTIEEILGAALGETVELEDDFAADADGWTLGTGWSYDSGNGWVEHTPGNTDSLSYPGTLIDEAVYWLVVNVGGTTGTVTVRVDASGGANVVSAGAGSVTVASRSSGGSTKIMFVPSSDFDGYINNVTVVRTPLIQDALPDGSIYARQDQDWVALGPVFAPIAKGVTNGDSHNHVGGDGGLIDHANIDSVGIYTHDEIDDHIDNVAEDHFMDRIDRDDVTAQTYNATTWYDIGSAVTMPGYGTVYIIIVRINYTSTAYHTYTGVGVISPGYWKNAGAQHSVSFPLEQHNGNDIMCYVRFKLGSGSRIIQMYLDTAVTVSSGGGVYITLKRLL